MIQETLNIAAIQTQLHWENKQSNLKMFTANFGNVKEGTDVVILPEMFNTGFSMRSKELAEPMNGVTMQWMFEQAAKLNAAIAGSLIIEENGKYYNRFIWMNPDGSTHHYDKRHLFRMGNEHEHYSSGKEKNIFNFKGWKICPQICYDLRFPVWSRNRMHSDKYDVLLYVANWPERRNHAWKALLLARAIENQAYVIGVNRIGIDGNNINHTGDSAVIDFLGQPFNIGASNKGTIMFSQLKYKALEDYRVSFPASLDADDFEIK